MPVGKTGKYHMNPHEMRRKGDAPDDKGSTSDGPEVENSIPAGDGGDGHHHHEIHETDAGHHSVHTHPDGAKEEADHGSYEEARDHQDQMMGDGGQESAPVPDDVPSSSGGDDDIAGMYASHCK